MNWTSHQCDAEFDELNARIKKNHHRQFIFRLLAYVATDGEVKLIETYKTAVSKITCELVHQKVQESRNILDTVCHLKVCKRVEA